MVLKNSDNVPFGSTVQRFGYQGVHPKWRPVNSSPNLGPGYYNAELTQRVKSANAFTSLWKRHYHLQKQADLIKAFRSKQTPTVMGGATKPELSTLWMNFSKRHSFTKRGPIDTLAKRFPESQVENPGVGTYGIGGNPYIYKESMDRLRKSASSVGMMSSNTSGERNLPTAICALGPGTYKHKEYLNEILNKQTGCRGPYDLFTGPRYKYSTSDTPDPGAYEIKSFLDKWNRPEHCHSGKFRRITDQMSLGKIYTPAVGTSVQLGPGKYDPVLPTKKQASCQNVPFLSRSSRSAGSIFAHHPHPVGPGRYDVQRYDDSRCIWGAMSAFDSQTPARPDLKETQKISERLRPINIPPHRHFNLLSRTIREG
ncbi:hypothetical protein CRM22_005215 [Opisthorchis felineus]|uniref:Uncharacterized protein n=1 Tax=Opisthorchis felineus TaxID=147828 RepID=A0A4S2LS88_OPIFE|nr:hypothetical protein CRM22_005215 [Opisthorchis felineus]TGZ66655.1 hypothetical protein CRM22_005215 [Opisthorchis felineus]